MAIWKNEAEARERIKALVAEYYHDFKEIRISLRLEIESAMRLVYLTRKKCVR